MPRTKTTQKAIIDKLPPQNIEAEKSLIGSLLIDKESIDKVADILDQSDFYNRAHQIIYEHIIKLYEKREPIDLLSLSNLLEETGQLEAIGGVGYLTSLINSVPTAAHAVNYAKIVRRKKILRDLIDTAHEIISLGYQEDQDIEALLDQAEQRIFSVSQKSSQKKFDPIEKSLAEAFERLDNLHKGDGGMRGIPSGFYDLDNITAGFQRSDLIVIGARPSLGKSTLALDITRNAAKETGLPVGFFSLEMSKDQVVDRLIAAEAGVSLWKLRTGHLSSSGDNNDFEKIQRAFDSLSRTKIFIDDPSSPTVLQIRAMARRLQAEHGLGLLVIDYLQLMKPQKDYNNPVQEVSEITRNLKGLARELNIPLIACSQLSRATEVRPDQRPKLSDLRESGCVTGDTEIMDAETGKIYTIKELAESKKQISVWSLDETLKIKKSRLIKAFPSGVKTVFNLKLRSGKQIKASANHPFYSLDGWQRLDQLEVGSCIATPRALPELTKCHKIDDDKVILLAHLLGDGCYVNQQPIHYTSSDLNSLKIVARAAKKAFGLKPRVVKQGNWSHLYLPSSVYGSNPLIDWLRTLKIYGQHSYEKCMPDFVFSLPRSQISLLLRHLWATDGNISYSKSSNNYVVYYATSSKKLAGHVQTLLLELGILSTIRTSKKPGYRIMYQVHIQGKENQLLFLNKVGVFGKKRAILPAAIKLLRAKKSNPNTDVIPKGIWLKIGQIKNQYGLSWRDFAKKLHMSYCGSTLFKHGVSRERMSRITAFLKDPMLTKLQNSDIYWDEIISIEKIGEEPVYDATIENTHNFIANNIFIHNSIEQDSDLVLFIYREDKVKRDSERKNIAEIIVAKHRNGPTGYIELYFDEERVSFRNLAKNI
jgi:replicative DNA helicase